MNLKKHIIDTIKEWQLKIGYREGNMKLYYPGESLAELLGVVEREVLTEDGLGVEKCCHRENCEKTMEQELQNALKRFCEDMEPLLGRIKVSGSYDRYCLDIPAKGCAYVAGKVEEPSFLKLFLESLTKPGCTMERLRECFDTYGKQVGTSYREELITEQADAEVHGHHHAGHAFYFADAEADEYVYWVDENEFGLTYHRFTRVEFQKFFSSNYYML